MMSVKSRQNQALAQARLIDALRLTIDTRFRSSNWLLRMCRLRYTRGLYRAITFRDVNDDVVRNAAPSSGLVRTLLFLPDTCQ